MVQLINPFYLITNVIFMNREAKYIFVERQCWNTIVALIWKTRRPERNELRAFKEICFDIYDKFVTSGKVDFETFHKTVEFYQEQELDFRSLGLADQEIPTPEKEVRVSDESGFFVEEYLSNKDPDWADQRDKNELITLSNALNEIEEEAKLFLNLLISFSIVDEALVKTVGYARALSIFRILLKDHRIKLHGRYEFLLLKRAADAGLLSKIIKLSNDYQCYDCTDRCDRHVRRFYLCGLCNSVNCHTKYRRVRVCDTAIWYDIDGPVKFDDVHLGPEKIRFRDFILDTHTNLRLSVLMDNAKKEDAYKQETADHFSKTMAEMKDTGKTWGNFTTSVSQFNEENRPVFSSPFMSSQPVVSFPGSGTSLSVFGHTSVPSGKEIVKKEEKSSGFISGDTLSNFLARRNT